MNSPLCFAETSAQPVAQSNIPQDAPLEIEVRVKTDSRLGTYQVLGKDIVVAGPPGEARFDGLHQFLISRVSFPKVRIELVHASKTWSQEWPWVEIRTHKKRERFVQSHFQARTSHLLRLSVLTLRDYLLGVIPAEMPVSWPKEALKAQAVASTSYLVAKMLERRKANWPFDVEATVNDQRYQDELRLAVRTQERVLPLLAELNDQVLLKADRPLTAHFHADCGGRTEGIEQVWGGGPGRSVSCPYPQSRPWLAQLTKEKLSGLLGTGVHQLQVESVNSSGRVQFVRILTDQGPKRLSGHQLRMLVGHELVRSARFTVQQTLQPNGSKVFEFRGRGQGHGVGLCQNGSAQMARLGQDYRKILLHYYPGSEVRPLAEVFQASTVSKSGVDLPKMHKSDFRQRSL